MTFDNNITFDNLIKDSGIEIYRIKQHERKQLKDAVISNMSYLGIMSICKNCGHDRENHDDTNGHCNVDSIKEHMP